MVSKGLYWFQEFQLNPSARTFLRSGKPVAVSPKAFEVLTYLVEHPGRVISKDELLKAVWPDSFVEESNLAQHISWLRKALGDKSSFIATVPGRGYQFTADVREEPAPEQHSDSFRNQQAGEISVQTMREHAHLVIEESSEPGRLTQKPATARSRYRLLWITAAIAGLVAAGVGVYRWLPLPRPVLSKVLLADFRNETGEAIFDDSLQSGLRIDLAQSPYIDLMSRDRIVAALETMNKPADTPLTADVAREVCERENYQVTLTGGIVRVGTDYLLTLEASNCLNGQPVAAEKIRVPNETGVLAAMDSLTRKIRSKLGEPRPQIAEYQVPLAQATTPSLEALRDYSIAIDRLTEGDEKSAEEMLQKAVALDPNFASAWMQLGNTYYNRGDNNHASIFYKKGFDLRDHATARERMVIEIRYYDGVLKDSEQTRRSFQTYLEIYPDSSNAWGNLCNLYTQLGEYPQAIAAGEAAVRTDPHNRIAPEQLARAYKRANRFEDAKRAAQAALANGRDAWGVHSILFQVAWAQHDQAAIESEGQWGLAHDHANMSFDDLGFAAATAGRLHEAMEDFNRARTESLRSGDKEYADEALLDEASALVDLGELRQAAQVLKQVHGDGGEAAEFAILSVATGDSAPAMRLISTDAPGEERDTIWIYRDLLLIRAELALKARKPADAVELLEPARLYQLRDFEVPWLRARAEVEAGQLSSAVRDYQLILANPGIDPLAPVYYLSHLELGRVLVRQQQIAQAHTEYQAFLNAFRNADASLPLVQTARREYAMLP
jgi:eukaryotic-like serine/threonine-protein kinase